MANSLKRTGLIAVGGAAIIIAAPAAAQEASGDWYGTLEPSAGARLPLVVHLKRDDAGALGGTMDSPAQGASGIPLAAVAANGASLTFTVPAVSGSYRGEWDQTGKSWKGEWSQAGMHWPLVLSATPPAPPQPLPVDWQLPANGDIAKLIAARNAPRPGEGIVVGLLGPDGRRVVAGGPEGAAPFDGDTLFEIGSISKVFTALILADMANKGEVSLDDPAEKYLPAGHHMPRRGDRQITLRDLSQHISGLPRLPDNMAMADPDNPYADYTEAQMLAFLDRYQLPRDIGSKWEYSNLGVGLLGYLLARAGHTDYDTLLRERITGPLGMKDTAIMLSGGQLARFAAGHDAYMRPAEPWELPMLKGAGGIRSTASDMLRFVAAVLDPKSPIGAAVKTTLSVRVPVHPALPGTPKVEQALGWQVVEPAPGREVLTHDGGTGGFRSSLAIEPAKDRAAVVLINSAAEPSANDLALHLLVGSPVAPTPPVPPPPPPLAQHKEISLPAAELDKFVGSYDLGSGIAFAVTHDADGLKAQRRGSVTGPVLPIFPEAPRKFFWKAVDAEIEFIADADGKVTGAHFTQGGFSAVGKRVEP